MNIEYFTESLDFISYTELSLPTESILLIKNSLCILQNENKFKFMFFWGCIKGIERDYYVAFGVDDDFFLDRKYFYSTNCYQWIQLPNPNLEYCEASTLCLENFLGDPSNVSSIKLDPSFAMDENQIILATEPLVKTVKEEDRLACAVHLITEQTALVPRGALYKMVDMNIVYNPTFCGLDELEALNLNCYQLLRKPLNNFNYNSLNRDDYNYAIDFLDTLDNIHPKEYAVSINLETSSDNVVIIRSKIWPGMTFFHKLGSRKHGFVYFGDCKKNFDLLFMV